MSARSIIATALWIITVVIHTVNAHFGGKISAIKIHDYAATRTKGAILELFIFLWRCWHYSLPSFRLTSQPHFAKWAYYLTIVRVRCPIVHFWAFPSNLKLMTDLGLLSVLLLYQFSAVCIQWRQWLCRWLRHRRNNGIILLHTKHLSNFLLRVPSRILRFH